MNIHKYTNAKQSAHYCQKKNYIKGQQYKLNLYYHLYIYIYILRGDCNVFQPNNENKYLAL